LDSYELFFDGACLPNPGGIGSFGFVLYKNGEVIDYGRGEIGQGPYMTSVVADYYAVSSGLDSVIRHIDGQAELAIYGDSQYAVSQITKPMHERWDLQVINFKLKDLARMGVTVSVTWTPRASNKIADELAKVPRSWHYSGSEPAKSTSPEPNQNHKGK
jgi:ribonuclease H / adenosylcobalamin/alpha-ribazole phosphatase